MNPSQRRHHAVIRPARRQSRDEKSSADPGQQNQHVALAGQQRLAERKDVVLVGRGDLAHRRREDRLAAVLADQGTHFRRPTALEADDPQAA